MDITQLNQLVDLIAVLNGYQRNNFGDNRLEITSVDFYTTDSEQTYRLEWDSENGFYVSPVLE